MGVDYLGPLLVKHVFAESEDENLYKVQISLFTCAVTRAVHLVLVSDLSAASFIQCLKRFIARRGVPRLSISDDATCFQKGRLNSITVIVSHCDTIQG